MTASQEDAPKLSAEEYLTQGQERFVKQAFGESVELFAQAVEALNAKHGEMSIETVDALILYGKALLRHAVASSGVFGAGTANNPPQDAVAGPSNAIASTSTAAEPPANNKNILISGDDSDEEDQEAEGDAENQDEAAKEPTQDPDDDLGDAYEILDMARAILVKQPREDKDLMLKLANVHSTLGEVATESEKFKEAADEYLAAISVLESVCEPHDRRIAEMHLMAALSYEYIPQSSADISTEVGKESRDKAVSHAEQAKKILLMRKDFVVKQTETSKEASEEVDDIDQVLADLDEKIEELKTMPEVAALSERDKQLNEALAVPSLPADAPKNDLSNMGLVKKKKKPTATEEATVASTNGADHAIIDGKDEKLGEKRKALEAEPEAIASKKVKINN